jgi:glutamine---fructose-6-phosphate transaminase (isomerizing)
VYIQAGPEIGVASTKAYTAQLLSVALIAIMFSEIRESTDYKQIRELKQALLKCPDFALTLLEREKDIEAIAGKYYDLAFKMWEKHNIKILNPDQMVNNEGFFSNIRRRSALRPGALYIGRGINLPSALEGALKLKEISYIHAEGCSAGEMKHGPIALIEPSFFTVAIAVQGAVREQMIANIMEIKARNGPIIAVATDGDKEIERSGVSKKHSKDDFGEQENDMIWIPKCPELISPVLIAIPLQFLAYHIARKRGEEIDQPRNLAKTVTVE